VTPFPLRFRTLRTRVTLWYGAIITLCLLAYSAAVGLTFRAHMDAELDRRVHEDIELAARALLVDDAGRPSWPGGFLGKQVDEEEGGGHWIEIWNAAGERLLATGTIEPSPFGPSDARPEAARGARSVALPGGGIRVMTESLNVKDTRFLVRAAVSEAPLRRQVRMLWLELAGLSATVLILGGFGGYVLARRLLGPLVRMAAHAGRITAEQLHERLSEEPSGAELDQLREAFNETLARLERSFGELRRFTADASHEIRTPLTALRSVGEVGMRGAKTPDDYREVIGTMLEEVDRLSQLADQLLTLSRAEAGQAHLRAEPVDLCVVSAEVVDRLSVLAEERGQRLECRLEAPVLVRGDRLALRQALMNLVDNAIKYAPEGSRVLVASGRRPGRGFVEVRDEGPGIPVEHREQIFERFYRIDSGRSREMGGTGLGLSLVKWTAEAHGGSVELDTGNGGSTFRLVLPAA
jgi:heavy metal sensor kinase